MSSESVSGNVRKILSVFPKPYAYRHPALDIYIALQNPRSGTSLLRLSKFRMKLWQTVKEKLTLTLEEENKQVDEKGVKGEDIKLILMQNVNGRKAHSDVTEGYETMSDINTWTCGFFLESPMSNCHLDRVRCSVSKSF